MREELRRFLARHRRHPLVRKAGRALGYFWDGFENQDHDVMTNGEQFAVACIGKLNPSAVLLDVGAHYGEWAGMATATLPQARIHSFEAVPSTHAKLQAVAANWRNVTLHNIGLGEAAGSLEFAVARGRDDLTSGVAGVHGELHKFDFDVVRCELTTGDAFCARHGIERVGFLKIDVEGMEPQVIRGFARMLQERRIDALQFEYGQVNLKARFFLGDFYQLLGQHGMRLGKLYPNHVDFREYHFTHDRLLGPNFIAVPAENEVLIRLLAG